MKAKFLFGIALLIAFPSLAQVSHRPVANQEPKHAEPECPDGRGCRTLKQMWDGGDNVARSATWACFTQTDLGYVTDRDEVLLLRDGVSVFEMHMFVNGIERLSSEAQAEYFRDGIAHWEPGNGPTSLDVTKSNETLTVDLRYTGVEKANEHLRFTMRLSSGRFKLESTIEKRGLFSTETSAEDITGQCVLLHKPTR